MILGVDYAAPDGNHPPDFTAARAAGVRFAIVRAAYGASPDPTCARDRDAIRAAGLVFGAYLFPLMGASNPPPETQVKAALSSAHLIPGKDLPLVLDIEFPHGLGRTRTEIAAWIGRAVEAVRDQAGCDPMIYSSARVLDDSDTDTLAGAANDVIKGCPLWLARYKYREWVPAMTSSEIPPPPVPDVAGDADNYWIHQFQGDALRMPGFSNTVDLNRWNRLCLGAQGARVAWVERKLKLVDGEPSAWDDAMDAAVVAFQLHTGLVADGVIGPRTFAALAWS